MFWKNYFSLLSGRLPESKSLLVCDPRNHRCFISVGDYYRCAQNSECLITVDAVKFLTKSNTHLLIYDKIWQKYGTFMDKGGKRSSKKNQQPTKYSERLNVFFLSLGTS